MLQYLLDTNHLTFPHNVRFGLVCDISATNNDCMIIPGRVHNGMVILEGGPALPEGAAVSISYPALDGSTPVREKPRIQVPLVRSERPGSILLTGARIAEILDEEDASPRR
jgi:hypothetical protein